MELLPIIVIVMCVILLVISIAVLGIRLKEVFTNQRTVKQELSTIVAFAIMVVVTAIALVWLLVN